MTQGRFVTAVINSVSMVNELRKVWRTKVAVLGGGKDINKHYQVSALGRVSRIKITVLTEAGKCINAIWC